MKKLILLASFSIALLQCFAQTSPAPFNLYNGTYTFSAWDSTSAALTYPNNMMFHTLGDLTPSENSVANGDWACTYDTLNSCWIRGKGNEGVAFKNTGSSQIPACMINGSGTSVYVGDATVALNTLNCTNITVSWIARMLNSFNFVNSPPNQVSRFYGIACQYRLDTISAFINLPGDYLFICNSDSATYKVFGTTDTLSSILPDTCNNQPLVEVRWIYHQTAQNAGGPRPILGLDDINITRDIVTANASKINNNKPLNLYPNPNCGGKINLSKATTFMVVDMLGQTVSKSIFAKEFDTDNLSKGIYFIKTTEGEIVKFIKQ